MSKLIYTGKLFILFSSWKDLRSWKNESRKYLTIFNWLYTNELFILFLSWKDLRSRCFFSMNETSNIYVSSLYDIRYQYGGLSRKDLINKIWKISNFCEKVYLHIVVINKIVYGRPDWINVSCVWLEQFDFLSRASQNRKKR